MPKMDFSKLQGWVDDQHEVEKVMNSLPFPVFADIHPPLMDTGKKKVTLLHKIVAEVTKFDPSKVLYRHQTIGDCVAQGGACVVDCSICVDIFLRKDNEIWLGETCTEILYWGSRVVIGKGRLGNSDGSVGAWLARFVNEWGAITRGVYGKHDLSKYDGNTARLWGSPNFRISKELENEIKEHPIQTVSLVRTYEEARDLIANGYAITVASNIGFNAPRGGAIKRDADGFLRPYGNWSHQMAFIAADDEFKRPGLLCNNSWGNWVSGPTRHDQPSGSFWVDADVVNRMLGQGDSWAFSSYIGYKPRELNLYII